MSDGLISVAEPPFATAVWQQEDADWERWQWSAVQARTTGNHKLTSDAIARALQIARQHFEPGDPRLASSLASHALVLSEQSDPLSNKLFTEALGHWDQVKNWLKRQPTPRLARSSMFHLRLETKHPGDYPDLTYQRCAALAQEGREATITLAKGDAFSISEIDRSWRPEHHGSFDTLRKITAAVRLIAHR